MTEAGKEPKTGVEEEKEDSTRIAVVEEEEEIHDTTQKCRFYEERYPEVDEVVMVEVKSIEQMGAYVALKEYNDIEGMILLSELSRRRIRSIAKIIRVGRLEPVIVLRVDKEKGYIDLSKRRVSDEDVQRCEEKYTKAKTVHSIMRHVADASHQDLEAVYIKVGWPLYKKYGHAYEAFKLGLTNPTIFDEFNLTEVEKSVLMKNIARRLSPQPVKLRADIEVTCFHYEGIDAVKKALQKGADSNPAITVKLVAPPLYVVVTTGMNKDEGIELLNQAIAAIQTEIVKYKGDIKIKVPPRTVHERDEKEFHLLMQKLEQENEEKPGDEDTSDVEGEEEPAEEKA